MTKVNIELEQAWTFTPVPDENGIDLPPEYVEEYLRLSRQFFAMNSELEDLFRQQNRDRNKQG